MYSVELVLGVQHMDSVIHINEWMCVCIYILFQNLFYKLLQHIEYSSLCYTVGPCCSSILYIGVYILIPNS